MPPRTNAFQRLVFLVRQALAENSVVTESKMMRSRLTGRLREVDICIEGDLDGEQVFVCLECTSEARKADVSWVEKLHTKHQQLDTNVLILASQSGFTAEAKTLAEKLGIKTIALTEVDNLEDSTAILGGGATTWLKEWTLEPTKITVLLPPTAALPADSFEALTDNLVFDSAGKPVATMKELVVNMLNQRVVAEVIQNTATIASTTFRLDVGAPLDRAGHVPHVQKLDPLTLRPIAKFVIEGNFRLIEHSIALKRALLGDTAIAWGSAEVGGRPATFVVARDKDGSDKGRLVQFDLQDTSRGKSGGAPVVIVKHKDKSSI